MLARLAWSTWTTIRWCELIDFGQPVGLLMTAAQP
jgi:hypothetical protein